MLVLEIHFVMYRLLNYDLFYFITFLKLLNFHEFMLYDWSACIASI